jgi:hypothetical protein
LIRNIIFNISAISPEAMKATIAVDQTLTCNIGDVTQAVDVSWKNNDGGEVKTGEGGYTVTKGAIVGGKQASTLKIAAATLAAISDTSKPLTWKCAAKSTLYPDSEISAYKDLIVTFLNKGT